MGRACNGRFEKNRSLSKGVSIYARPPHCSTKSDLNTHAPTTQVGRWRPSQPWGSYGSRAGANPRWGSEPFDRSVDLAYVHPSDLLSLHTYTYTTHTRALIHPNPQPQRDRIYESTDLSQFRGKRLLIDAASFVFWLMEDVLGKQASGV